MSLARCDMHRATYTPTMIYAHEVVAAHYRGTPADDGIVGHYRNVILPNAPAWRVWALCDAIARRTSAEYVCYVPRPDRWDVDDAREWCDGLLA